MHDYYAKMMELWVFAYNTENMNVNKVNGEYNHFYGTAAGIKQEKIVQTFGLDKTQSVTYFDVSLPALELKQHLVENWDGYYYNQEIVNYMKSNPIIVFNDNWNPHKERTNNAWPIDELHEFWKSYTSSGISFQYQHIDIIDKSVEFADSIKPKSVVWLSNIFGYLNAIEVHGRSKVDNAKMVIMDKIESDDSIHPIFTT